MRLAYPVFSISPSLLGCEGTVHRLQGHHVQHVMASYSACCNGIVQILEKDTLLLHFLGALRTYRCSGYGKAGFPRYCLYTVLRFDQPLHLV